jgi:uncharacterized protein YndB with AHSA1/START domain
MSTIAVTRVIPAPVERVWAVFADLDGRRRWLPDVVDIEVLTPWRDGDADRSAFGPGAHWRETRAHPSGRVVTEGWWSWRSTPVGGPCWPWPEPTTRAS